MTGNKLRLNILGAAMAVAISGTGSAMAAQVSGAIFTTTYDGGYVNGNVVYDTKEDVYLDGGPGPNAPASAAGLPAGDYYFQVTDPSGMDLLSTDHISCRKVRVNAAGVIEHVYPGINYIWSGGAWAATACQHVTGIDLDHPELGATTVQLFPYDDTPNQGGVYKVWMTPVQNYAGDAVNAPEAGAKKSAYVVNGEGWQPGNAHGFIPSWSKTDNYKVDRNGKPFDTPQLTVLKFHDANANSVWDDGEVAVEGWSMSVTDPLGVTTDMYTPVTALTAEAGAYTVQESTPAGTRQTVAIRNQAVVSEFPSAEPTVIVNVEGVSGERNEVIYGNVGAGSVTACKVYDRDGDGVADADEPGVPGWKFQLDGVDVRGAAVGPLVQEAGADGCTVFADLMPGEYTVIELQPATGTWFATGATSVSASIESMVDGSSISATATGADFTNACTATADFGTKGYWHNKNGLAEITQADIEYVNSLLPYAIPSSYFGDGDEPFDGYFQDGTPVAAAYNNEDVAPTAAAGTPLAEISHFLVDTNAGADPREQLGQQLLAFIFNTRHRLDDASALLQFPDGSWAAASDLIADAIALWANGSAAEQHAMQQILDAFNNSDAQAYVPVSPCAVTY